ncbi:hypothetical protein J4E82_004070 [Alternaria postmessia]|uniref:uncharacterized protein n=1 Tax=Alternaria postmessia TaxID=1187938 RepID=UPI0022245D47|nr:uncharacterized protein J4E82_004070 [Alternaria postmessia]KAI5377277.1 hypothetical protein J4E82_004070 [Alternaria postmessia]
MAAPLPRPRIASTLIAERDGLEQDIRNNNAAIEQWAVLPRWNWQELQVARILGRRLEREVILLTIEIDIALTREVANMEWLMSLSQGAGRWNSSLDFGRDSGEISVPG